MLVFFVLYRSVEHPLSNNRVNRRNVYQKTDSRIGQYIMKIMVRTMELPATLYQLLLKSVSRPPVSPNEIGYSRRFALTNRRRNAVLKN